MKKQSMHGALRALVMPVAAMTALLMPATAEAQHSPEEKMAMMIYAVSDRYVDSVAKAPYVDAQIARMAPSPNTSRPRRQRPMNRCSSA